MWDNKLTMTMEAEKIEIIITNKESGNSHIVTGCNWTEVTKLAISDTQRVSAPGSFKF